MRRLRIPASWGQGMSGACAWVASETLPAASPTISIARVSASRSISSLLRSMRSRPATRRCTVSSASTICRSLTISSGGMEQLRSSHDLVPEITAQLFGRAKIDGKAAEHLRKLDLHLRHIEQGWRGARFELDQQVDVAVAAGGPLQPRTEQRQAADAVAATEFVQQIGLDAKLSRHDIFLALPALPIAGF